MSESMKGCKRTHYCGHLGTENIGEKIVIMGWVHKRRDHGGVIFVDIRDRSGLVQVVFNPELNKESFSRADQLRSEYVVAIAGEVRHRPEGTVNEDLPTGQIEIEGENLTILAESKTPPILVNNDELDVGEDLRLKYRYLDLRRSVMKNNIELRHKITKRTRDFLDQQGFWEIETPILTKSTPEGARDYLVPSRVSPGQFFALPQSPQLFKQLLMVSGMEKYFQIARCFRDEDLRANRQPEFTQIDIEMSFVDKEDVMDLTEVLMKEIFSLVGIEVPDKIPVLTYQEAMDSYGSDKPDLRFGMKLMDISPVVTESKFRVFSQTIADGGQVKGINVKGGAEFSRSKIDELTDYVKLFGAKGLAWIVVEKDEIKSPIQKFLADKELNEIIDRLKAEPGDLLLFIADKPPVVASSLGNLRLRLARELDLIPEGVYEFAWIVDFPLLEYAEEEKRYIAKHHPFTSPLDEDIDRLETNPEKVRANAYDLVLNGEELGGGSIRIHTRELQEKVFNVLNIEKEEVDDKFGYLLDAFDYGAPPHGGIAFGLDRMVMIISNADSIRDVIAFPKTQKATSPLTNAPTRVSEAQLKELRLRIED